MPRYKQGMKVKIVQAECGDPGCNCGLETARREVIGRHGKIYTILNRQSSIHRGRNPHHYAIDGEGINSYNLWTDQQLKRYHGCEREDR